MAMPTLRAKNQVTLPGDVIRRAGFRVGEPLVVEEHDGVIQLSRYMPEPHQDDWLTDEVLAEIDAAANEAPGAGYDTAEDMIAALRRG